MAHIEVAFDFRGARAGAREEFVGKLMKSYPRSFAIIDDSSFTLSIKDPVDAPALQKMLRSFVPLDKLVSYHFTVKLGAKTARFGGP